MHAASRRSGLVVSAVATLLLAGTVASPSSPARPVVEEELAPGLTLLRGPSNGAILSAGGKALAFYGDPRDPAAGAELVLFTHHRRDVVWAGRAPVEGGAKAVVPESEAALFAEPARFWQEMETRRFHDYEQQTTKVIGEPIPVARTVRGGQTVEWEGTTIRVLDTPGPTRGSVSYILEVGGRRIAFTGDLVLEGGRIPDLHGLQDAIPDAKIGGYHGFAARLGDVVASLGRIAAEKPDILVPCRGPAIRAPAEDIEAAIGRIRAAYANYLSIDALRWYFGDDHIRVKARRVLGPDARIEWMPMAAHAALPPWVVAISNSRLILSSDGSGFLLDCGGRNIIDEIEKLRGQGKLRRLEHVFVTHYHDDHTDQVSRLVELLGPTVHASLENIEVLEDPASHRLPCLTSNPLHVSGRASDGDRWRWKEFEVSLHYFPGQTIRHDALLVRKDGAETVLFVGDSFTPSGIDDYCLQNRNLLHEGRGFLRCLDFIETRAKDALLVNQHVEPAFRFSTDQIARMRETLRRRAELLRPLFPWDDPNYGTDEGWARMHPWWSRARGGQEVRLALRVFNHSPVEREFAARVRAPRGWAAASALPNPLRIPARQEGSLRIGIRVPDGTPPGPKVITVDLAFGDWELREWTEAVVVVEK